MSKFKLKPIDELFNIGESIDYIYLNKLETFENHPFSVNEDEDMEKLIESIKINGVITPVILREKTNGNYEVISGHRRTYAAHKVGLDKIPAIVKNMTDDEAVIAMVDANLQRENIKPSEKAKAYKMKMDAMKHQCKRTDLTLSQVATHFNTAENCGQLDHKSDEKGAQVVHKSKKSREIIAEQTGESGSQVQRYIRLTHLIPELLELVDAGKIKLIPAVNVSYLPNEAQQNLYEALNIHGKYNISLKNSDKIRKAAVTGKTEVDDFLDIISPSDAEEETTFKIELCLKLPIDYSGIINATELEKICNEYINKKLTKENLK